MTHIRPETVPNSSRFANLSIIIGRTFSSKLVSAALILICLIWTLPTVGLLVTSFRERNALDTTGWWTIFQRTTTDLRGTVGALPDADAEGEVPEPLNLLTEATSGFPASSIISFGGGDLARPGEPIADYAAGEAATMRGRGTLQINADGSFEYIAPANYPESLAFQYRAEGRDAGASIIIPPEPEDGVLSYTDYVVTNSERIISIEVALEVSEGDVLGADTDLMAPIMDDFPTASLISLVSFGNGDLPRPEDADGDKVTDYAPGTRVDLEDGGALLVNADGSFEFTPGPDFEGGFDFEYRVQVSAETDLFGGATVASFGGGDLPRAGDSVRDYEAGTLVELEDGSSLQVNSDGSYEFTPGPGFTGEITLEYRVRDPIITFENYEQVIGTEGFVGGSMSRAFLNSLTVTIPATVIPIAIAAFAAYAFAWMNFPGRRTLFIIVVALQVVPLQLALIPLLRLYMSVGLNGTFLGLWLAHTGFGLPLAIFLLRNYIAGLPRELIESASIDGASHFDIFVKLIVPLSVPALASFTIFQFLWVWNDLLVAIVFLGTGEEVRVVTAELNELVGSRGQSWHLLTSGAFVTMVLPLVVFFALQRYFVRGLLAGSVKGG